MQFFLLAFVTFFSASIAGAYAQTPPDAAPSTPVDMAVLPAFEPTREEAVLEAYVDGVVAAHMREHDAPGLSVSVVQEGRTLFAKGYGVADVAGERPVSGEETLFRIGSVSKTFIWTAVMMLHEQGRIDLDADVNIYLKNVRIPDAFGAPVTMNHLMAHRAGFEDTLGVFTIRDTDEISLSDALNEHMPKRVFPPGARVSYSNWGAALAALIVQDIAGVSYEVFLTEEILTPLGMTDTTLSGPDVMDAQLRAQLADGVKVANGGYEEGDFLQIGPFAAAGAMSSTAADMAIWMQLHMGQGGTDQARLMTPETHALLRSRAFTDQVDGADLAHGFISTLHRGVELYGHGGATSGFYTTMVMAPELGIGVYASQNTTADRTLVSDLPALLVDHVLNTQGRAPKTVFAEPEGGAAEYAGQYINNRRSFSQFEKLFAAASITAVTAAEDGVLSVANAAGATQYQPVAAARDVFESKNGERIVFGRNSKGQIAYFAGPSGVHTFERTGLFTDPTLFNAAFGAAFLFGLTTWAGAWRRQGKPATGSAMGVWLSRADFLVAGLVFVFFGLFVVTLIKLSSASPSDLIAYPPLAVSLLRIVGMLLFGAALALLASLPMAWRGSGWSLWRKAHHTGFVLALAFLAVMLVAWRVIFSGVA